MCRDRTKSISDSDQILEAFLTQTLPNAETAPRDYDYVNVHVMPVTAFDYVSSHVALNIELWKGGKMIHRVVSQITKQGELVAVDNVARELRYATRLIYFLHPPKKGVRYVIHDPVAFYVLTNQIPPPTNTNKTNLTLLTKRIVKLPYHVTYINGDVSFAQEFKKVVVQRYLKTGNMVMEPTDEASGIAFANLLAEEKQCRTMQIPSQDLMWLSER